jgi:hypothetical protein
VVAKHVLPRSRFSPIILDNYSTQATATITFFRSIERAHERAPIASINFFTPWNFEKNNNMIVVGCVLEAFGDANVVPKAG